MAHRDDMEARALGALDADEARRFDAEADEATLREVDAMRESLATLASTAATAPPVDLKARLLAQIATTPQERQDSPASVESAEPVEQTPARAPGPRERAAMRKWSRGSIGLAAAAAAVVALIGGVVIGQVTRPDDPVAALVHAADVDSATLQLEAGGTATLLWSDEQQTAAILMEDPGELPDGQVFEAWWIRGEEAVSAGTFQASAGTIVHVLEGGMQPGDVIGVTIEPEGGSEAPTTDPIVVVETA